MSERVVVLVAALADVVGVSWLVVWRDRRLRRAVAAAEEARRALAGEAAARRLMEAVHHRDARAFEERLRVAMAADLARARAGAAEFDCDVIAQADAVIDQALAAHRTDLEGGTP